MVCASKTSAAAPAAIAQSACCRRRSRGNKPWSCRTTKSCCWLETTYIPYPPKEGDKGKGKGDGNGGRHPREGESVVPGEGGGPGAPGTPGGGGLSFRYVVGPCGGMLSTDPNLSFRAADPELCQ